MWFSRIYCVLFTKQRYVLVSTNRKKDNRLACKEGRDVTARPIRMQLAIQCHANGTHG